MRLIGSLILSLWLLAGVAAAAPVISIATPVNGATVSGTVSVTATASGVGNFTTVQFYLDGVNQFTDMAAPWSWSWDTALTTTGAHRLYVRGYDASSRKFSRSRVVGVTVVRADTTPPTGSVTINGGATYATTTAVTLTLSASDPESGVTKMQLSNDNVTYATPEAYATSKTWTLAAGDGAKTVYAQFQNGAGLWSTPVTATIMLDTTPPAVPSVNPVTTPINQVTQALSGTKEANTGVWLGGSEVVALNSATTWSYTVTLTEGDNAFSFTAQDAAGNVSAGTSVTIVRDMVAPTISDVTASAVTGTSATITWTTDEVSNSQAEYGATTSYGSLSSLEAAPVTSHSVALSGLTPATTYHYRVRSTDAAGNVALSADQTFATADTTPPMGSVTINNGAAATNTTTVTLTLAATDAESGVTQMQLSNDDVTYAAPAPYATSQAWALSADDGTKAVYVKFQNGQGLWSSPSSATILLDTTPPAAPLVNPVTSPTNQTSQLITGTKDANSGIRLGEREVVTVNSSTSWSDTVTLNEGENSLTFTAQDAVGNVSGGTTVTISRDMTSPPSPTINAPLTPTNQPTQTLAGTRAADAVTLAPSSTTATFGAMSYPTPTTWSLPVTCAVGSNVISVTAADSLGNVSAPAQTTIVYDPNLDVTPPTGTISINAGAQYATSLTVTLTLSATDAEGSVTAMRFSNDNVTYADPEPYATTKSWTLTAGDGMKTVYAQFKDQAGNWSSPVSDTITLDTTPPNVQITDPKDQQIITGP